VAPTGGVQATAYAGVFHALWSVLCRLFIAPAGACSWQVVYDVTATPPMAYAYVIVVMATLTTIVRSQEDNDKHFVGNVMRVFGGERLEKV